MHENMIRSNDVVVVGLGYIGLPTAAFLASTGLNVLGIDIDSHRVEQINQGQLPFVEPGLDDLLSTVVSEGTLKASVTPQDSKAFIIAVPTPFKESDHTVDDSFVLDAARTIAPYLQGSEIVILESTSPPGLTKLVADLVISLRPDLTLETECSNSIYFAYAPERVLPGRIMEEMTANSRIIGEVNLGASERAARIYSRFCRGEITATNARTAELTKLTENAFRDVNIAFANELSLICDCLDIDVWELIDLANKHPRVNILQPGPGVGGHCIAVDPWFIVSSAPKVSPLIRTAREVNDSKPAEVIRKVDSSIREVYKMKPQASVAVLGLTFKPDIDDLRESPAIQILRELSRKHPTVQFMVVEPNISALPKGLREITNVKLSKLVPAIEGADITLLLVDHKEFKLARQFIQEAKNLIDTRGLSRP